MPKNQFERCMFALITVIVTVHAYVFYSLYVVNGSSLIAAAGNADGVLAAINSLGGVYMFGTNPFMRFLAANTHFYTFNIMSRA